jgi:hypothetical protein
MTTTSTTATATSTLGIRVFEDADFVAVLGWITAKSIRLADLDLDPESRMIRYSCAPEKVLAIKARLTMWVMGRLSGSVCITTWNY